jgi:predicted metal-binding protein
MPRVGILGCEATARDMDCVMIGCFGNLRGRQGSFEQYSEDDPPELIGIIHCGGCPTAFGAGRVWQKVKALAKTQISASYLCLQGRPCTPLHYPNCAMPRRPVCPEPR